MRSLLLRLGLKPWLPTVASNRPMVLTVDTTKTSAGSTAADHFKLPLTATGTYKFVVDWGDGTSNYITAWNAAAVDHTYAAPGVYTVTIYGKCYGWKFNNTGDKLKLTDVLKWGTFRIQETGLHLFGSGGAFRGCNSLTTVTATDLLDLRNQISLREAFRSCDNLTNITNVEQWDLSTIVDLSATFQFNLLYNQPLNALDVSNITTFNAMFEFARVFNQPLDNWNVSNAIQMGFMFDGAYLFDQNIGGWNVSKCFDLNKMFQNAFAFNNGGSDSIKNWNVSKITAINSMFRGTAFNQPLNDWDIARVTDMGSCFSFNSFSPFTPSAFNLPLDKWNVENVTTGSEMFRSSSFKQDIGNWWLRSATNLTGFFTDGDINNVGQVNYDNLLKGWTGTVAGAQTKQGMSGVALVGAGLGYTVEDTLIVTGGTYAGEPASVRVTSVGTLGEITGIQLKRGSGNYTALPANDVSVTGGTGAGATFSLTWATKFSLLKNNLSLNMGSAQYSLADADAVAARAILVLAVGSGGKGWTIIDGGGV